MSALKRTHHEVKARTARSGDGPFGVFGLDLSAGEGKHMKRASILSALVLVVFASGTAAAQNTKAKYTRNTTVKVDVKISDRTRPLVENKEKKQALPELSADDVLEVEG